MSYHSPDSLEIIADLASQLASARRALEKAATASQQYLDQLQDARAVADAAEQRAATLEAQTGVHQLGASVLAGERVTLRA